MQVDTALEYDTFPLDQPVRLYLMVLVKASSAQNETKRRALNLSLVIDRSGSMAGAKIDYTRRAANMLVQNLGMNDTLSVVLYNDTVDTLLMPEKVQRKDIINQQISRITPSGATNLSGGWLQGCNLVAMNHQAAQTNRVILISDGLANRGVTETEKLLSFATQKFGEGISTTTMGLGDDFNEELLMQMANSGGGAYYYIDSPEVMPTILNEELTGLLKLVGQNLTISISGPLSSNVRQMNAYPEEPGIAGKTFRLGDVFGDEIKALVLEVNAPAFTSPGTHQLAALTVDFDELTDTGASHQTIQRLINVTVSGTADKPLRAANAEVIEQVMLLKAAQARRRAVELADNGKFSEASQVLEAVIVEINESAVGAAPVLEDEKESLAKQASDLSHTAANPSATGTSPVAPADYVKMRKKMASQAFYTMTSRHNETVILRQRMEAPTESPKPDFKPLDPSTQSQVTGSPKFAQYGEHNYPIEGEEMHFGRAVENDVIINERGVSRYHCVLRKEGDVYWLEDTGSTNGTVVNGVTVKGRHSVRPGDVVHIGEAKIRFHNGESE